MSKYAITCPECGANDSIVSEMIVQLPVIVDKREAVWDWNAGEAVTAARYYCNECSYANPTGMADDHLTIDGVFQPRLV